MEAGFLLHVLSSACISWYIFSTLLTIFRPIKSTLYSVFYSVKGKRAQLKAGLCKSLSAGTCIHIDLWTYFYIRERFIPAVVCFHNIQGSYGCWGLLTASRWSGTEQCSTVLTQQCWIGLCGNPARHCVTRSDKVSDLSKTIIYQTWHFHFCVAVQVYHLYGMPFSALLIMSRPDGDARGENIRSDDQSVLSLQLLSYIALWGSWKK